jgi:hypothetical protein
LVLLVIQQVIPDASILDRDGAGLHPVDGFIVQPVNHLRARKRLQTRVRERDTDLAQQACDRDLLRLIQKRADRLDAAGIHIPAILQLIPDAIIRGLVCTEGCVRDWQHKVTPVHPPPRRFGIGRLARPERPVNDASLQIGKVILLERGKRKGRQHHSHQAIAAELKKFTTGEVLPAHRDSKK